MERARYLIVQGDWTIFLLGSVEHGARITKTIAEQKYCFIHAVMSFDIQLKTNLFSRNATVPFAFS